MRYSGTPRLSDAQKTSLRRWLSAVLNDPELSSATVNYPLSGYELAIYRDGQSRIVMHGYWGQDDAPWLKVGMYNASYAGRSGRGDRLAIIGAIIGLAELTDEYREQFGRALSRIIFEQYSDAAEGLILVRRNPVEMAINTANQTVAVRFEENGPFYLPGGAETVTIDETWRTFTL